MKVSAVQKTDYLMPHKIVEYGGSVENIEGLLTEKELQVSIMEPDITIFRGGFVVLDFGRELHGGIRILTCVAKETYLGVRVRIRFGESLSEAYSDVESGTATNNHSPRDFVMEIPSFSDLTLGQTGFRFVRIDFLADDPFCIKNIYAASNHFETPYIGNFECSDPLINEIFHVSAYTAFLNLQNGMIWDGIKRDRLVWAGDLYPEIKAFNYLYGAMENVENSLNHAKNIAPLPNWMSNMPPYSMWWIIMQYEYYLHTGDKYFLQANADYLKRLIDLIYDSITENGKLIFDKKFPYGHAMFLDWQTANTPDAISGTTALCKLALQKSIILFDILNLDGKTAKSALVKLERHPVLKSEKKQAIAMQILAGELDAQKTAPLLKKDGACGMTTFMSYIILDAFSKSGSVDDCINMLKSFYGAMLDRGATSFWEDFNMDWLAGSGRIDELPKLGQKDLHGDYGAHCYIGFRHSLCHGWACGAVPYLFEQVLGIKIKDYGCKVIEINPHFGDGITWAKGCFPTPYGIVTLEHKLIDDKIKTNFTAPDEVKIIVKT